MTSVKRKFDTFNSDYMTTQFLEEVCSSNYINTDMIISKEKSNWGAPKEKARKISRGKTMPKYDDSYLLTRIENQFLDESASLQTSCNPEKSDPNLTRNNGEDNDLPANLWDIAEPTEANPDIKSLSNLDWLVDFKLTEFLPISISVDSDEEEVDKNKTTKKSSTAQGGRTTKQDRLMERIKELLPINVVENNNNINCVKAPPLDTPKENFWNETRKPPFTYTELIEHALREKGGLTVSEIYAWISANFPFYRAEDDRWKNSVRHNLSINPHFRKGRKAPQGAGHLWELVNSGMNQSNWLEKMKRIENFIKDHSSKLQPSISPCEETERATRSIERLMEEDQLNDQHQEQFRSFEPDLEESISAHDMRNDIESNIYHHDILEFNSKASLCSTLDCEEIDLRDYRIESNASIEEINLEEFNANALSGLQGVSNQPLVMDSGGWILVDDEIQNAVSEMLRDHNSCTPGVEVQYLVPFPQMTDADISMNINLGPDSFTKSAIETIYYSQDIPMIHQLIDTEEEGVSL